MGERRILSLSGGKDSTALAIYMRDRVPGMEYVFMDTGEELPETYAYLERLEAFLGVAIVRLNPDRPFRHYLELYGGVLPDARTRWCTRMLKIKPFERYVGGEEIVSYVAIRHDERDRKGYISSKANIRTVYPFVEDRIDRNDVSQILTSSGLGLPDYYRWRSRSGCYFCFFQRLEEWVGLLENHPELFEQAAAYEKHDPLTGQGFTWNASFPLSEMRSEAFISRVRSRHARPIADRSAVGCRTLVDLFGSEDDSSPCTVCSL